ncbi:FecR family protein [uncultured Alistipes sp.]|uniref:FecR family protein n=1 Tax=uncultured Alistipes sp. TaxID=538949 RepID=UPI0025F2DBC0|nr:FecR family protein [uncultured Alistipes sp.]
MNRPPEELLYKTLENRATAAEAATVAEWLATEPGQAWASRYVGRDFENQEVDGQYEQAEIASERLLARIMASLNRNRRRRILFRVAAAVIPVALVLGVLLHLDKQVGGIFSGAEYGEFVVDRGRRTQCLFQDGTIAYLNSESKINYPVKFGLFERRIRLEGEAYFEVVHNPRRPFVIEFEGGEVEVLGTSFNIKAYGADDIVAVTLDQGRVVLDNRRGGRYELAPSEQLLYDRRSGTGEIVREADAIRYSIWKDDVITFRDAPLDEVLETLSRWYDVRFEVTQKAPQNYLYTFTTDNTLLDNVLREMELITPVSFERDKSDIKVSFR